MASRDRKKDPHHHELDHALPGGKHSEESISSLREEKRHMSASARRHSNATASSDASSASRRSLKCNTPRQQAWAAEAPEEKPAMRDDDREEKEDMVERTDEFEQGFGDLHQLIELERLQGITEEQDLQGWR